ncbi:hypothetical protein VNI00_006771 [Paramarasmius palmivorus]|uniref:F-box domain-containing protein n=1 Tax=Paramarasmius palmivorus TaxID=297713 RepID=A0AAW0D465_9AGAR
MAIMQDLADELLEYVAENLGKKDMKALRLVNKNFCSVVTPLLFISGTFGGFQVHGKETLITYLEEMASDVAGTRGSFSPHFRKLQIVGVVSLDDIDNGHTVQNLLFAALRRFTRLRTLTLDVIQENPSWLYPVVVDAASGMQSLSDISFLPTNEMHPRHPPLTLQTLQGLRSFCFASGLIRDLHHAQQSIFLPIQRLLSQPYATAITRLSLFFRIAGTLNSPNLDSIFPPEPAHYLEFKQLQIRGFTTRLSPAIQCHFHHLTHLSIAISGPDQPMPNGYRSLWDHLRIAHIHVKFLYVALTDRASTGDLMRYLSSYSGLREFHLRQDSVLGVLSLEQARDAIYRDVLPQHSSTLRMLALPNLTEGWGFVDHCRQPLEEYGENIEILHLSVDFPGVLHSGVPNTSLVTLLNTVANLPKLRKVFVDVFDSQEMMQHRPYRLDPNQQCHAYLRTVKLDPPTKPRLCRQPLVLQRNHHGSSIEHYAFRLTTAVPPCHIGAPGFNGLLAGQIGVFEHVLGSFSRNRAVASETTSTCSSTINILYNLMPDLPNELIESIIEDISKKDLKTLRLVNKNFCSAVTPLLFARCIFGGFKTDGRDALVTYLKEMASDTEGTRGSLSPYVRELMIFGLLGVLPSDEDINSKHNYIRDLLFAALRRFTGLRKMA